MCCNVRKDARDDRDRHTIDGPKFCYAAIMTAIQLGASEGLWMTAFESVAMGRHKEVAPYGATRIEFSRVSPLLLLVPQAAR